MRIRVQEGVLAPELRLDFAQAAKSPIIVNNRPLYASSANDNVASIRVLEKCGFAMRDSARALSKTRGAEIDEIFELAR